MEDKENREFLEEEFRLIEQQDMEVFEYIASGKQWEEWDRYKKNTNWFKRIKIKLWKRRKLNLLTVTGLGR